MFSKTFVYIGAIVGSIVGSCIPLLWGAGIFSISSLVFSTIGALIGIFLVLKFMRF
jgi:uncharacterized membrane protein YeaQ/YmgE (transglycosylase-associated protein family)